MTSPVAPELFDVLSQYAKDIEDGKVQPAPSIGATSPALTFCENFYAQFFQNRMGQPIEHFNLETKKAAVRLRLESVHPPFFILCTPLGARPKNAKSNDAGKKADNPQNRRP